MPQAPEGGLRGRVQGGGLSQEVSRWPLHFPLVTAQAGKWRGHVLAESKLEGKMNFKKSHNKIPPSPPRMCVCARNLLKGGCGGGGVQWGKGKELLG